MTLRISELAARTGVPPTTLRYYEQVGLLTADRTPAGYRVYDQRAVERLRFINAGRRMQLSLGAIGELLHAWQEQPCRAVKARLRPMVSARLAEADDAVEALRVLAAHLRSELAHLDALPDRDEGCDSSCAFLASAPGDSETSRDGDTDASTSPSPEMACSLTGGDHAARLSRWHALLAAATVVRGPCHFRAAVPAARAGEVTDLVVAEQACCPFLGLSLTFRGSVIELTVSVKERSAQPFLDTLLPQGAR